MVRQALGAGWTCHFANDFDGKKALSYQENWGIKGELCVSDIRDVDPGVLGSDIDLAWASFPCQDLSLAGRGRGLKSERSGMFFVFWQKLMAAAKSGAAPKLVVIENVCGMLTSNRGDDFRYVIDTFSEMGYFVGGLVIDAKEFVPQSRKRVFIIGVRKDRDIDPVFVSSKPNDIYHAKSLVSPLSVLFLCEHASRTGKREFSPRLGLMGFQGACVLRTAARPNKVFFGLTVTIFGQGY